MFAIIGGAACVLFAAVGSGGALWAGLLSIIGNVIHNNLKQCLL